MAARASLLDLPQRRCFALRRLPVDWPEPLVPHLAIRAARLTHINEFRGRSGVRRERGTKEGAEAATSVSRQGRAPQNECVIPYMCTFVQFRYTPQTRAILYPGAQGPMPCSIIGLFAAAAAGLLSFLSPCVLPLVPPYLTWLAGSSLEEITGDRTGAALRPSSRLSACRVVRRGDRAYLQPTSP